jgi:alkylation response protein AidB-like acyl-CoA dehydrogenase
VGDGDTECFLVERDARRLALSAPHATLGARGLGASDLVLDGVWADESARLGAGAARAAGALVRLAHAATAVGLAQAAFEAALRYSQQRSAFGKPICQHQAIQLKLADMATAITATRLLVGDAGAGGDRAALARIHAADMAATVTLEAMRIHGGYGYTTEFPVARYYRDAARLAHVPTPADRARAEVARRLRRGRALGEGRLPA